MLMFVYNSLPVLYNSIRLITAIGYGFPKSKKNRRILMVELKWYFFSPTIVLLLKKMFKNDFELELLTLAKDKTYYINIKILKGINNM